MIRADRKAGQVRYWQYGQAGDSPNLAISDLSRFPLPNGLSCVQSAAETSTPLGQIQDGGPDRWRQAVPVRDQLQ